MRVNFRIFLVVLVGFSFLISLSYVNRCPTSDAGGTSSSSSSIDAQSLTGDRFSSDTSFEQLCSNATKKCQCTDSRQIDVDVNDGEALVSGRKEGSEVFVPFSFVRKYFDIYGKFEDDRETRFLWSHR